MKRSYAQFLGDATAYQEESVRSRTDLEHKLADNVKELDNMRQKIEIKDKKIESLTAAVQDQRQLKEQNEQIPDLKKQIEHWKSEV